MILLVEMCVLLGLRMSLSLKGSDDESIDGNKQGQADEEVDITHFKIIRLAMVWEMTRHSD